MPLAARAQRRLDCARRRDWPIARRPAARLAYPALSTNCASLALRRAAISRSNIAASTRAMAQAFAGANELVAWRADVLFAFGPELALQAAAAARPPVPIVHCCEQLRSDRARLRAKPIAAGRQRHRHRLPPAGIGVEADRAADRGVSRAQAPRRALGRAVRRPVRRRRTRGESAAINVARDQAGKSAVRFRRGVSRAGAGRRGHAALPGRVPFSRRRTQRIARACDPASAAAHPYPASITSRPAG